jgi:hypothetical protein
MLRFGQWAKRQFRSGYGSLDYSTRFGRRCGVDLFRRQILSVRLWTLGWATALVVAGVVAARLGGPAAGASAAAIVAMALPAQAVRIGLRSRGRPGGIRTALAYGFLTMVGKFYQMAGQLLYLRDRLTGRHARLIEYKFAATAGRAAPSS